MDTLRAALRRIPLFAELPDATLDRLARLVMRRAYGPGEIIIVEGDPCQAAYLVAEGLVSVYRLSPGGRQQVLARLGSGQAFNTVPPFLAHGVNHATAQALTKTAVFAIPSEDLRRCVSDMPDLALALLHDFALRLDHMIDLVEDLALRSVRARLARFLLEHAEAGAVSRRWTQDEMAACLGTVRDVVGRTLRALADGGMLRLDRQRIVLLDKKALEAEVER